MISVYMYSSCEGNVCHDANMDMLEDMLEDVRGQLWEVDSCSHLSIGPEA